jgi:DNA mismatch repair ATPase MutS
MQFSQILSSGMAAMRKRFKTVFGFRGRGKSQPDGREWELSDSEKMAYYQQCAKECAEMDLMDERTWSDLEMEKVYLRLNQCVSPLGAQYLYAFLRKYESEPKKLEQNVNAYQTFKSSPAMQMALREALGKLNRRDCADLANFLLDSPPKTPSGLSFLYLASALAILCPFGLFLSPWFLPASLVLWSLNIFLHHIFGTKLIRHSPALVSLGLLLGCVPTILQAIQDAGLPELKELQASKGVAKKIQKQISLAFLRRVVVDDLFRIVIEYLNLICLFEVIALCRAIRAVNAERPVLLNIFQQVARLDALQAISTVLGEYPAVCVPEIRAGRGFSFMEVQHPLVSNAVCNSIEATGNSLLLTGTNMAGKTTFIKTLAVNAVLAQTVGVCLARKAVLPPVRVRTLIAREDIVGSGQSYFYFEASELLRMLKDAEKSGREYWFVLDEIFRGTNTIERVSAGSAVLSHLNSCGVVIASTHDHELTSLLRKEFDLYHFSEVVDGREVKFDYVLRKGPCVTRNAIKLLTAAGFPKDVIEEAERLVVAAKRGE